LFCFVGGGGQGYGFLGGTEHDWADAYLAAASYRLDDGVATPPRKDIRGCRSNRREHVGGAENQILKTRFWRHFYT